MGIWEKIAVCVMFLWLQSTPTIAANPWNQVFLSKYDLTFYDEMFSSWYTASKFCKTIGADLVQLKDSDVVKEVLRAIEGPRVVEMFWLGATGRNGGDWTWIDGTTVDESLFTWGKDEPKYQDRLYIRSGDNTVGDAMHNYAKAGAICQRIRKSKIISSGRYTLGFYLFNAGGISHGGSYNDAQSFCVSKQSRLVVVTDSNLAIIKTHINVNDPYWISKSSGCTVLINNQEERRYCNEKNFPICEQVEMNSVTLSQSSLEVTESSATEVICRADGYPTPSVLWKINGADVSLRFSDSVYQAPSVGNSTLLLHNAKVSDEGNYACFAQNSVSGSLSTKTMDCLITVPSFPVIDSITPFSCNTSLAIAWKPHYRGVGVKHRIRVQDANGNTSDWLETPFNNTEQFFLTGNLKFSSSVYTITIQPCSSESHCYPYNTKNSSYTGGIPEEVTTAFLYKRNGNCQVSWSWPLKTPKNTIESYQINVTSTSAQESASSSLNIYNEFVNSTTFHYTIAKVPNRKYTVSIKAKTCAGFGASVPANGTCVTDVAAPTIVPTPQSNGVISDNGTCEIILRVPENTNGFVK